MHQIGRIMPLEEFNYFHCPRGYSPGPREVVEMEQIAANFGL